MRPPQSLVVSLLFSRIAGVLCHLNSLTHRFPQFPPRNLCSLVMLAVSSLVYAATDAAFFYVLISLGLAELRILPAGPADARPRAPLISFCTVQLRTICGAHSLATLCLFTTCGSNPGELPGFWGSMVFRYVPSLGRGRVTNNNGWGNKWLIEFIKLVFPVILHSELHEMALTVVKPKA